MQDGAWKRTRIKFLDKIRLKRYAYRGGRGGGEDRVTSGRKNGEIKSSREIYPLHVPLPPHPSMVAACSIAMFSIFSLRFITSFQPWPLIFFIKPLFAVELRGAGWGGGTRNALLTLLSLPPRHVIIQCSNAM